MFTFMLVWNIAFMASMQLITLHICPQAHDHQSMSVPGTSVQANSSMSKQLHATNISATATGGCEQADLGPAEYKPVYLQLLLQGTLLLHHSSHLFLAVHGSCLTCLALHLILFLHNVMQIAQQCVPVVLSGQGCNYQERHAVTIGTAS
jgi:hypothetical protein